MATAIKASGAQLNKAAAVVSHIVESMHGSGSSMQLSALGMPILHQAERHADVTKVSLHTCYILLFDWVAFVVLLIIHLHVNPRPPLHSTASITAHAQSRRFNITNAAKLACMRHDRDLSQGQSDLRVYMQQLWSTALQSVNSAAHWCLHHALRQLTMGTVTLLVDMVAITYGVGHCSAIPVQHANQV